MAVILRSLAAIVCIGIGFAGLIMPILPGWLFFGVAAMLLFPDSKFTRHTAAWIERHFPRTKRILHALIR